MAVSLSGAACTGSAGDLFDEQQALTPGMSSSGRSGSSGGRNGGGGGQTSAGGVGSVAQGGSFSGGGSSAGSGAGSGSGSSAGAGSSPGNAPGSGGSGRGGSSSVGQGAAAGSGPGPDPEPVCDPCPCGTGPFGEPELVSGLGVGVQTFGAAPSSDGLTLFFSAIDGDEDLFFSTRQDRANQFSLAAPLLGVNDPDGDDGTPFVSVDGRALYFFSTRPGPGAQGGRDLWVATRASTVSDFTAPAVVPGVNTEGLEHLPRLSSDGSSLLFVSSRESDNLGSNIWVSERDADGEAFGEPSELPGVNTDAREEGFWLSEDGLTLFFASNRALDDDMDIWTAVRPSRQSGFEAPENLSAVNTSGIEIDPALTADGFELFFASDRSGTMQLYRSARSCP